MTEEMMEAPEATPALWFQSDLGMRRADAQTGDQTDAESSLNYSDLGESLSQSRRGIPALCPITRCFFRVVASSRCVCALYLSLDITGRQWRQLGVQGFDLFLVAGLPKNMNLRAALKSAAKAASLGRLR